MKKFLKENWKYFVIVLVFAALMFFGTRFAITKWNAAHELIRENVNPNPKCIDLNGTYDANDLHVEQIDYRYKEVELELVQISGLKNKNVENKINTEIQSIVNEQIDDGQNYINTYSSGNFSNILSVNIYTNRSTENEYEYEDGRSRDFYLNYNLNDGSHIIFEDLFVNNANIGKVVRSALYDTRVTNAFWDELYKIEEESEYLRDDRYDELHKIPMPVDDDKLTNDVIHFLNLPNDKKCFTINPSGIALYEENGNNYLGVINFEKNASELAVYDRYVLGGLSLYKEKFAPKNVITCADFVTGFYTEELRGEQSSNLYIDFVRTSAFDKNNAYYDVFDDDNLETMNKCYMDYIKEDVYNGAIKDIKNEASKNKDYYFVCFLGVEAENIRVYNYDYQETYGSYPASNAVCYHLISNVYKIPMKEWKETYHDRLIESYRSPYFVYSADRRILTDNYDEFNDGNPMGIKFKSTDNYKIYDFVRGIEIDDLDKMFDGAITYEDLEEEFRTQMHEDIWRGFDEKKIEDLLKEGVFYDFTPSDIRITSATDESVTAYIYYSDIDIPLFTIYSDEVKEYFYDLYGDNYLENDIEDEEETVMPLEWNEEIEEPQELNTNEEKEN